MNEDEYDDDESETVVFVNPGAHIARFLWSDLAFLALRVTGNLVTEIGQAIGYASNIAAGHANYRRMKDNEAQSRRSMEDDLAALSGQEVE